MNRTYNVSEARDLVEMHDFVEDVLIMFRGMQEALERLRLVPFGGQYLMFPGFHRSHEKQLLKIARSKIYDERILGDAYVSHFPKLLPSSIPMQSTYARTLDAWEQSETVDDLTFEDCEFITRASYPEWRCGERTSQATASDDSAVTEIAAALDEVLAN